MTTSRSTYRLRTAHITYRAHHSDGWRRCAITTRATMLMAIGWRWHSVTMFERSIVAQGSSELESLPRSRRQICRRAVRHNNGE